MHIIDMNWQWRVSKLENKLIDVMQSKEQRKIKNGKKNSLRKMLDTIKPPNYNNESTKWKERKEKEKYLKK